jgi:hypothetical protein
MIDYYELFNVALVNAGIPTPLSPMPSDIRYYTDMDEQVIECSQNMGYNAIRADLSDPYDIQLLKDTDIAIATGVFHFLSDIAFQQVFNNFAKANFRTIIFNHADSNNTIPLSVVNQPLQRTTHEISSLLPKGWRIVEVAGMLDLLGNLEVIGSRLHKLPNLYNIYIADRCEA